MLQAKDQIGSFFYFPSLGMQKAAGGYGGIKIYSRPRIPVPFPFPAGDHTVLAGDWYKKGHQVEIRHILDMGKSISNPNGLIINGRGWNGYTFDVEQGKTYRFRISNVGLQTSINFRIQGHKMKLVEVEGSHTVQNTYDSLDLHVGQSASVLVTTNQQVKDYYVVVSSRFTRHVLTTTAVLHYKNSRIGVSGPPPGGPTTQIAWSLMQARTLRWNLTASGPRPNPQGSYHYTKTEMMCFYRCTRRHGQQSISRWTTWGCGTYGQRIELLESVCFVSVKSKLHLAKNIEAVANLINNINLIHVLPLNNY
ncbi:L-ascorbate oxidase homolog [Bidens hawaiensis]|uniref:L-ascorbate oxidase homolog n=1 Tax=Bidens hawaiensis TaxID=980011 RepID=UPI00404B8A8D